MTTPKRRPTFMDRVREAPKLVKIGVPIVLVLLLIGALSGGKKGDTSSAHPEPSSPTTSAQTTTAPEHPSSDDQRELATRETTKPSAEQLASQALGDSVSSDFAVGDSEVQSVKVTGQLIHIVLSMSRTRFDGDVDLPPS